jgi:hypothetical protein
MVAVEEKIRTNLSSRTSVLLQRVFALQKTRIIQLLLPKHNYKKQQNRSYKRSITKQLF